MATIAHRDVLVRRHTAAAPRPARKSIDEWSDKQAGYAAAIVVGALGLVFLLIIAGVVLYATSWGYSVVV